MKNPAGLSLTLIAALVLSLQLAACDRRTDPAPTTPTPDPPATGTVPSTVDPAASAASQ